MSGRVERYNKRKAIIENNKKRSPSSVPVDQARVDILLGSGDEKERMEGLIYTSAPSFLPVDEDGNKILTALKNEFHSGRVDDVISELGRGVFAAIAGPFGLGKALSVYDKVGGNVTTVNNANNGVYASDEDRYDRKKYDRSKNSQGKRFAGSSQKSVGAKFTVSMMDEDENVTDAYTGRQQKATTTSPDHIESLSQFHKDGGFMIDAARKADFATDTENLALTDQSINKSMRDFEKREWLDKKREDGASNAEYYGVKRERVEAELVRASKAKEKHLPDAKEKAEYYMAETAKTGVSEGAKMGFQQAVGVLLVEFFSSSIVEIKDLFKNGLEGKRLIDELKIRLGRVAKGLIEKKNDLFSQFSGGFLSGLLSNLVTTIVNMFVTTGKRVVRMIREGVMSLVHAVKIMIFPPEGMKFSEVMHESTKLVFAGGVVVAGVLLEEAVEKVLAGFPVLTPVSAMMTAAIVGSLTAVAAALVVYLVDKMDVFNAIKDQELKFVAGRLDEKLIASMEECESLSYEISSYV